MAADYDLVIVGAGSGNMLLPTSGLDGLRVAIIERDRFGGTCLNWVASIRKCW
jgi:mycothione reductase